MKHADLIAKMSLKQKTTLCSGKDFWHLASFPELGIPEIMVTDGPHGLRKQNPDKDKKEGVLGGSFPATCFPSAATTSCAWDEDLLFEMGEALGDECLSESVSVLLGPGVNIKRSPLCGRNFEYFSEDPFLAGKCGAAFIKGVQSKGIGTSLKHFACNSQEARRMYVDSVVDERALREIFLPAFEESVKEGKPWTVMNAYNRLNGTYCAENKSLLTDILRKDWGYEGIVVTDWGAENSLIDGIKAGQNLEMPSSHGLNPGKLERAVESGEISEEELNESVDKVLDLILRAAENKRAVKADYSKNHALARKIAGSSFVLLKNENGALPLDKKAKIAVIGEMAAAPRYQGAGSSLISPTKLDNALDELRARGYDCTYSKGYDKSTDTPSQELIDDAVKKAAYADVTVVFAGLTEVYESEGFDRKHLRLPPAHDTLISAVTEVSNNVIVVLAGGSAVLMPWLPKVKAVLHSFLGGQAGGSAVADVLSGDVCPSGKLTETYPLSLSDTPSFRYFPGNPLTVEYRESIYVGYRYYDKAKKDVQFPFGFGLSYTTFEYSALKLDKKTLGDTDTLSVSFKVKNTGSVAGAEVAQLYVAAPESKIYKAEKELKGFKKVFLAPGEEKEVKLTLGKRSFAFYNVNIGDWYAESGKYQILVGASSRDVKLSGSVQYKAAVEAEVPDYRKDAPAYYSCEVNNVTSGQFEAVLGRKLPAAFRENSAPIDLNCSLEAAESTRRGKKVNAIVSRVIHAIGGGGVNEEMMKASATQIPIRCFVTMSGGVFNEEMADGLVDFLNDKPAGPSIGKILRELPTAIKNLPEFMKTI